MKVFNFDFVRWRLAASIGSGLAILVSIVALGFGGLNLGLNLVVFTLV